MTIRLRPQTVPGVVALLLFGITGFSGDLDGVESVLLTIPMTVANIAVHAQDTNGSPVRGFE
jgi:hypothetical protein